MIYELTNIRRSFTECHDNDLIDTVELYPGIELSSVILRSEQISMHHAELDYILEINYCRRGRIGWKMGNGNSAYLGQTDCSIHTLKACADSEIFLPTDMYEGLTICIDLRMLTDNPPDILLGTGITGGFLYDKFFRGSSIVSLSGNEKTEGIFSALYTCPDHLKLSYQKIKVMELLLYLGELEVSAKSRLTEYQSEQIEIIRKIHDQLTDHIDQRFTIDELAKQYLMNPTTLKAVFKSVYGTSIAAHIKEHRMEQAAKLLRETDLNIAEIAGRVGYDSQSKFTSAFKAFSGKLPKDYRNQSSI